MFLPRFRTILLAVAASGSLAACAYDDGYGYGGMSVGYGYPGYDPYYDGGYYGYGGYGYDYGYPSYYGWYDDFYYPGIGIYVYDRGGHRHRWNDRQRRYWEQHRGRGDHHENWGGYHNRGDSNGGRGNWNGGDRRGNWNRGGHGNWNGAAPSGQVAPAPDVTPNRSGSWRESNPRRDRGTWTPGTRGGRGAVGDRRGGRHHD